MRLSWKHSFWEDPKFYFVLPGNFPLTLGSPEASCCHWFFKTAWCDWLWYRGKGFSNCGWTLGAFMTCCSSFGGARGHSWLPRSEVGPMFAVQRGMPRVFVSVLAANTVLVEVDHLSLPGSCRLYRRHQSHLWRFWHPELHHLERVFCLQVATSRSYLWGSDECALRSLSSRWGFPVKTTVETLGSEWPLTGYIPCTFEKDMMRLKQAEEWLVRLLLLLASLIVETSAVQTCTLSLLHYSLTTTPTCYRALRPRCELLLDFLLVLLRLWCKAPQPTWTREHLDSALRCLWGSKTIVKGSKLMRTSAFRWAEAEFCYLNSYRSCSSGVHLVFEVFQDTSHSNKESPSLCWHASLSCPFMGSNDANLYLVPISFWSRSGCWPFLGFLFYLVLQACILFGIVFQTKLARLFFFLPCNGIKMPLLRCFWIEL